MRAPLTPGAPPGGGWWREALYTLTAGSTGWTRAARSHMAIDMKDVRRVKAGERGAAARWSRDVRFKPPGHTRQVSVTPLPGETPFQAAARWLLGNPKPPSASEAA